MPEPDPHLPSRQEQRRRAARRRGQVRRRRAVALAVLLAAALAAGTALSRLAGGSGAAAPAPVSQVSGGTTHHAGGPPPTSQATQPAQAPSGSFTVSAVGDTMLGTGPELAPNPASYLASVRPAIRADAAFANLEGTLTDLTAGKCSGLPQGTCFEFRMPPSWARYLKQAGFTIVGNGNNHAFDFGQGGLDDTIAALDHAGLLHTGRTAEITPLTVHGIRTAWIGFGPYSNNAPMNDFTAARRLIRRADAQADVVVVTMHAGAEGVAAQHLTGRDETYFGENRGNPEAFARMAVDAGADLVLGSGPHVLRAMEIYRHRLIAYSLGNFAGYRNFATEGALGISAILRARIAGDGRFLGGRIVPVRLVGQGQPEIDSARTAIDLVSQLSHDDIGARAPAIAASGVIAPR